MAERPRDPAVFTIPIHRAFADSLAAGLIARHGQDPLALAGGRILLPNNRAVRTVTEAFVRLSGGGLLLPRLIPIGDPDLGERVGGALEPLGVDTPKPAIDPTERLLFLASILGQGRAGAGEALRLAQDLARTLDALGIEEIDARRLRDVVAETEPGAQHWEKSLRQLEAILEHWPALLDSRGAIDLVTRRNLVLRALERRWRDRPPPGFTVAAGITTAAPAVAGLLARVARMPEGMVVLPGVWLKDVMPAREWEELGLDGDHRDEPAHPQFALKMLLARMEVGRDEVLPWPHDAGPGAPDTRTVAIANAMAAPQFSHKWITLKPAQRRLDGVRLAEFPDLAAEAQGIALAMREAIEEPGRTAALVTPDRGLAERVSALLVRWGIRADDSAGSPLSRTPPGTLLLAIAALAADEFAPVALLAALKHPLAGGTGEARRTWLDGVRRIDLALRGPRPRAGLAGLDAALEGTRAQSAWEAVRPFIADAEGLLGAPLPLADFVPRLASLADTLSDGEVWRGQAGRLAADLLADLGTADHARDVAVSATDAVAVMRQMLDGGIVRPPYGGHPRLFIWGLLEARLQHADLTILGGLNEGSWPALPTPDPFLPPRIRADLGMPTLDTRIGLAASDFAHALGAPAVLITRAKRDSRSPTVASRFWLRLKAVDPDIAIDERLPALVRALDDPGKPTPASRPRPVPAPHQRPKDISVTRVDLLRADPFAFYASKILRLRALDPVDADASAAWKGTSVHRAFEQWLKEDGCAPGLLMPRIEAMLADPAVHPLVRSLWRARIEQAAAWAEERIAADRATGRVPAIAEAEGSVELDGIRLTGKADRLDRLADGGSAIVDYKTGHAPAAPAIRAGFRLQLGYLALIAEGGGYGPVFTSPRMSEFWSLARDSRSRTFGYVANGAPDGMDRLIEEARAIFRSVAADWLNGDVPFTAKAEPEYALGADYDQLMRLEEWYARL